MWRLYIKLSSSIIRELAVSPSQWNVQRSYADVARRLGVDEETVRNRLRQMKEIGLLRGWRLLVNPILMGREASILQFELADEAAKEAVISRVKLVEGVVLIQVFFGKDFQVTLFHEEEEGLARGIETITSLGGGKLFTTWRVREPACDHRPTETDWRIMGFLLKDAEIRPAEIAQALRVSARTAKRRLNEMLVSHAFFLQPILDNRKAGGVVPCHLLIQCAEERKHALDEKVISEFDNIVFRLTASNTHSTFTLLCENVTEGQEISKWIREQDGVESVKMELIEEQMYIYEWLESEIERQASATVLVRKKSAEEPRRRKK